MKNLEETWRWYGPYDPIALSEIIQAGATGIVTALHDIPVGDVWSIQDIMNRKKEIEAHGLRWSVVESVNVHDDIKAGSGQKDMYLEKYIETIQNLAACGIDTVCYNFMPALDWTRTNLERKLKTGAIALEFDFIDAITFDLFILKRDGAEADYTDEEFALADSRNHDLSEPEKTQLANTILQGLPGGARGFTLHEFRQSLDLFHEVDVKQMRNNLTSFLLAIVPAAEAAGIRLAIHPDDPPFSLFGLPRVVSTSQDVQHILKTVNSPANGLCFCTGSYGASAENDVPAMAEKFADSIHFLHLRNVQRESNRSFHESNHLVGSVDMYSVMKSAVLEQQNREYAIPYRPDHGHKILDDMQRKTNAGYPAIGRLKGLSELRGLQLGIQHSI